MRRIRRWGIILMSARALFTYLDHGSGSLLVQLLIAVIVGILATFRTLAIAAHEPVGQGRKDRIQS